MKSYHCYQVFNYIARIQLSYEFFAKFIRQAEDQVTPLDSSDLCDRLLGLNSALQQHYVTNYQPGKSDKS